MNGEAPAVNKTKKDVHGIELAKVSLEKTMKAIDNWPFDDIETMD